jgi:hypothetical protein
MGSLVEKRLDSFLFYKSSIQNLPILLVKWLGYQHFFEILFVFMFLGISIMKNPLLVQKYVEQLLYDIDGTSVFSMSFKCFLFCSGWFHISVGWLPCLLEEVYHANVAFFVKWLNMDITEQPCLLEVW